jgi:hypothetical protein
MQEGVSWLSKESIKSNCPILNGSSVFLAYTDSERGDLYAIHDALMQAARR